jgi:hypothetical protein
MEHLMGLGIFFLGLGVFFLSLGFFWFVPKTLSKLFSTKGQLKKFWDEI